MTKEILILEPDETFAARQVKALNQLGSFRISVVSTLTEACLMLTQAIKDLAFIPAASDDRALRSLRVLQPDLRLVVVLPAADFELPELFLGKVQGMLVKSNLEVELVHVLETAFDETFSGLKPAQLQNRETPRLDMAAVQAAIQDAHLGRRVQTAVLSQGPALVTHWGQLSENEAAAIAVKVSNGWGNTGQTAQMQFIHLPARTGEMLLYTRLVEDNYLLTLVALTEAPLSQLREWTDKLALSLAGVVRGRAAAVTGSLPKSTIHKNGRHSYTLAWRAVRPLPATMRIPLRRALKRQAAAHACILTYIEVRPELIHLVVICPPGRNSGWVAYLLKNGSEEIIQKEFGVKARLWQTGYYASESAVPLSDIELSLFLKRDPAQ